MNKGIFFIILFLLSSSSFAELPLKTYLEMKSENFTTSYIWGMARGMLWVSTVQEDAGGKALFCLPNHKSLSGEDISNLLDREISKQIYKDSDPVELIFLSALERNYPCN